VCTKEWENARLQTSNSAKSDTDLFAILFEQAASLLSSVVISAKREDRRFTLLRTSAASYCLLTLFCGYWCRHCHCRSTLRWAVGWWQSHPTCRCGSVSVSISVLFLLDGNIDVWTRQTTSVEWMGGERFRVQVGAGGDQVAEDSPVRIDLDRLLQVARLTRFVLSRGT
jgi:hypothetical protein